MKEIAPGIHEGELNPERGCLRGLIEKHGVKVVIGHPTFRNADNIGRQLKGSIAGAARHYGDRGAMVVVVDGTWTSASGDRSTVEAALAGAREAMEEIRRGEGTESTRVIVVVTPYEGYGGDTTPGKGSALKMIFEETYRSPVEKLVLLDGDLRNDMVQWLGVFARVERLHREEGPDEEFFVTARYARHFVDASLTRFIVGPLTSLLGTYVPGGISGDIVLSAGTLEHEQGPWSEARRKYGTDISTTFDNIADPRTRIYEVYLGAKLHDITDEGKLSVMPGEVIGAALESLRRHAGLFERVLRGDEPLSRPVTLGPDWTGVNFIDPGYTDVFDIRRKFDTLVDKWPLFREDVGLVCGASEAERLDEGVERLGRLRSKLSGPVEFLGMDFDRWRENLYRAVAWFWKHGEVDPPKRALNYLYTAAFLEFCRMRLLDLGLDTVEKVLEAQSRLGVPPERAREFYEEKVDGEADRLAREFYEGRKRILELLG